MVGAVDCYEHIDLKIILSLSIAFSDVGIHVKLNFTIFFSVNLRVESKILSDNVWPLNK
jgi:hypothetical protein